MQIVIRKFEVVRLKLDPQIEVISMYFVNVRRVVVVSD